MSGIAIVMTVGEMEKKEKQGHISRVLVGVTNEAALVPCHQVQHRIRVFGHSVLLHRARRGDAGRCYTLCRFRVTEDDLEQFYLADLLFTSYYLGRSSK